MVGIREMQGPLYRVQWPPTAPLCHSEQRTISDAYRSMETKYFFGSMGSGLCSTTMTLTYYGRLKETGPIGLQDEVSK